MSDLLAYALQFYGVKEVTGTKSHPVILGWIRNWLPWARDDSETAWCAIFVASCARAAFYLVPPKPWAAITWESIGESVAHLEHARQGDVVVVTRGPRSSWRRHVGILVRDDRAGGRVWLLGGNQSNAVNIEPFDIDNITAIRRLERDDG
jgi:uncharacterized protein (TIGR02594 family)